MIQIDDKGALDAALSAELFLLFKHSRRCGVSTHVFGAYEAFCAAHPEVPAGWIDVVIQRDWSDAVAQRTGVTHSSPQALLIRDGAVVWDASHAAITEDSLEAALAKSDTA